MNETDEKAVDILLAEYSALKSEILVQVRIYNEQSRFLQIYGALLFGFSASYLALPRWRDRLGTSAPSADPISGMDGWLATAFSGTMLLLAASIAFYFVSSVMSHSYMFKILRMRMASIEAQINHLMDDASILTYESCIAPHFLETRQYGSNVYTPYTISGVWRIMMLLLVFCILAILGSIFLPEIFTVLYLAFLGFGIAFHLVQYKSMLEGKGGAEISRYFSENNLIK